MRKVRATLKKAFNDNPLKLLFSHSDCIFSEVFYDDWVVAQVNLLLRDILQGRAQIKLAEVFNNLNAGRDLFRLRVVAVFLSSMGNHFIHVGFVCANRSGSASKV